MKKRFLHICVSLLLVCIGMRANGYTYVSGDLQHDGILEMKPVSYGSNSCFDLSVHYTNDSNKAHFHSLRASTRLELTQWPLPGFEAGFAGHGIGHLSVEATFDKWQITVGDVYGEFGSGFILNLHEDRALGIDGSLRGAKIAATPCRGIELTALGGKQRRYWECYKDGAWGWNYTRDAAMGADMELSIDEWCGQMRNHDVHWMIGGSWVSKYQASDTVIAMSGAGGTYMYNLPRWVGATDVRTELHVKGFEFLAEYAYKFNDPGAENRFSYSPGMAGMVSMGYSRKGLSVLAQAKYSENMSFRSDRHGTGIAGRLNHMPAFTQQHTYTLAALYPYATQYTQREWAMQAEIRYTAPRKTKFGGKYGTTLKAGASHVIVPQSSGSNTAYTDVNIELNKRISKNWWLNAMVMYQAYNQLVVEGHGDLVRSGIAVADVRADVHKYVSLRWELQYLYSPHHEGQWCFALCELTMFKYWTVSGQWLYNIGYAPDATNEHYYTAGVTFTYGAHRAGLGYTKTRAGFNCSGGVCRYIPQMEGMSASYAFTF